MDVRDPKRWFRLALACAAVSLVTALAANAATTRLKTIRFQPGYAKPGALVQGVIELSTPAPPGGVLIKLDAKLRCGGCGGEAEGPDAIVHVPREVYVPTGHNTGLFSAAVIEVSEPTTLAVTATLREQRQTATVQLMR